MGQNKNVVITHEKNVVRNDDKEKEKGKNFFRRKKNLQSNFNSRLAYFEFTFDIGNRLIILDD